MVFATGLCANRQSAVGYVCVTKEFLNYVHSGDVVEMTTENGGYTRKRSFIIFKSDNGFHAFIEPVVGKGQDREPVLKVALGEYIVFDLYHIYVHTAESFDATYGKMCA